MLEELKADIARLIALYEQEKRRADSLARLLSDKNAEASKYRDEVRKCKEQITDLNLQIDNLRLSGALAAGGRKGESLDRLIKEIDECIKLLEN